MNPESKLTDVVSEDGYYTIPVEWSVYSNIRVKADNLQQAIDIAKENMDDLPLCNNPEYVEDSYKISIDSDEDAIAEQDCKYIGDVTIEANNEIRRY